MKYHITIQVVLLFLEIYLNLSTKTILIDWRIPLCIQDISEEKMPRIKEIRSVIFKHI